MQKYEINGVEVKIGKWWRTRGGQIVQVYGICPNAPYPIAAYEQSGFQIYVDTSGQWRSSVGPSRNDLVEYLPLCTGFDWVAPTPAPEPVLESAIDPGVGWRLLEPNEPVELGDEFYSNDEWIPSFNWREEPRRQSFYPYRRRVAVFVPEFWYGSQWLDYGNCFAYAVRRKQGGPITYVKRDGHEFPSVCSLASVPHETWISITEEQALERLGEIDDMDDDDNDDDYDDFGTDDDSCGWTSNAGNSDYDESGDDHTVHVSIHIENLNIYVSNLNGFSGSVEPENTPAGIESASDRSH